MYVCVVCKTDTVGRDNSAACLVLSTYSERVNWPIKQFRVNDGMVPAWYTV
jgi:hypothetical protein